MVLRKAVVAALSTTLAGCGSSSTPSEPSGAAAEDAKPVTVLFTGAVRGNLERSRSGASGW